MPEDVIQLLDAEAKRIQLSRSAAAVRILEQALTSPSPDPGPHVDTFVVEEPTPGEKHWHRMEFPVYDTVEMKAGRQWAIHRCRCGKLSPKPYLITRSRGALEGIEARTALERKVTEI